MLPLYSPDSFGLRAAIGLFDPLGLALLGGCLPLPLSLRESTTRAFPGYRAALATRSFDKNRHGICFRRRNGMEVVGEYEFDRVWSIRKTDQSHRMIPFRWSYMPGLSTAAARSDLWRRIEIRVLLRQQQYSSSSSEVFYLEDVQSKTKYP